MADAQPGPDGAGSPRPGSFAAFLYSACEVLAVFGGIVLLVVTAFTVISVVGRTGFDSPVLGDQEIVEIGCAVALFSFMPYCQMRAANVVVEFFTAKFPAPARAALDAIMNAVFSVCIVIVTWRLGVGGIAAFEGGDTTMFLRMSQWWGYLAAFVACIAWSLACLYSVFRSAAQIRSGKASG